MNKIALSVILLIQAAISFVPVFSQSEATAIYDPFEGFNRGVFTFNDNLDRAVAKPIAKGYGAVTNPFVRNKVDNFYQNLRTPQYLVSDLLQLKFGQFLTHSGRFLVNSTVGLGGLLDVAENIGMEHHQEDFDVALHSLGVPQGPYIVVPVLGPSSVRGVVAGVVDGFLDPINWGPQVADADSDTQLAITGTLQLLDVARIRHGLLDAVETAKESSLDYYLFVQSAYYQSRDGVIYDGAVTTADFNLDDDNVPEDDEFADPFAN